MVKGKLVVAFVFTLFFAFFSRGLVCIEDISPGNVSIRCVSPGNLKNTNATNLILKKVVIGKIYVKTRYMAGDCSFGICSFSFHPFIPLFAEHRKGIPAYFLVPSCERFLFTLRGPPCSTIAIA